MIVGDMKTPRTFLESLSASITKSSTGSNSSTSPAQNMTQNVAALRNVVYLSSNDQIDLGGILPFITVNWCLYVFMLCIFTCMPIVSECE